MHPIVILVPLLIVLSGVFIFFLVPLAMPSRLVLLFSDVLAAILVGFVLWRRYRR